MAGYAEFGLSRRPSLAIKHKGQLILADLPATDFERQFAQLAD